MLVGCPFLRQLENCSFQSTLSSVCRAVQSLGTSTFTQQCVYKGWGEQGCVLLWGLESCSVHMPTWQLAFWWTLGLKINSVYFKVNVMLFLEKFHASKRLKKRKTSYDLLFLEIFDSWNCARCRTRQGCAAEVANSSWCCRYWRGELGKNRFTPSALKISCYHG